MIVGAQVAVTHKATTSKRETTTNDEGLFVVTSLGPGEYEVSVQHAGFTTAVYSAIVLQVGQIENLNVTLKVGQTSDTVTLDGERFNIGPLVQTSSSVVDRVMSRRDRKPAAERPKLS